MVKCSFTVSNTTMAPHDESNVYMYICGCFSLLLPRLPKLRSPYYSNELGNRAIWTAIKTKCYFLCILYTTRLDIKISTTYHDQCN